MLEHGSASSFGPLPTRQYSATRRFWSNGFDSHQSEAIKAWTLPGTPSSASYAVIDEQSRPKARIRAERWPRDLAEAVLCAGVHARCCCGKRRKALRLHGATLGAAGREGSWVNQISRPDLLFNSSCLPERLFCRDFLAGGGPLGYPSGIAEELPCWQL